MTRTRVAALLFAFCLALPMTARANGDPASHVLLAQRLFLPLGAPIDPDVAKRLDDLLEAADDSDFPIRVALIAAPTDLGTAFTLYEKPQEYAEFLGVELSFAYSDRLLVVMPNGFGFAVDGEPDEQAARVLRGVAAPGRDATKQARTATVAVRRLASAAGHRFDTAGGSVNRDRILIAAAALLGVTVLAALMLYHRKSRTLST